MISELSVRARMTAHVALHAEGPATALERAHVCYRNKCAVNIVYMIAPRLLEGRQMGAEHDVRRKCCYSRRSPVWLCRWIYQCQLG